MLAFLKSVIELAREADSAGSRWTAVALLFWIDAYTARRLGVSLVSLVELSFQPLSVLPASRWAAEGFYISLAFAAVWFYLMPSVVVPLWRWLTFNLRLKFPGLLGESALYARSKGWRVVRSLRVEAARENNGLVFALCEERIRFGKAREHRLACVLLASTCAAMGYFGSSDASGPALAEWFVSLLAAQPRVIQPLLFFALMPGVAYIATVLLDSDAGAELVINLGDTLKS